MPKIPAYQRIKSTILTKIHTGQWAVGSAIPTEMALSREFDVARMTVNRALKELTDEQVLERRQGSGTFVAQQRFNQTFITVRNIAHDIQNTGKRYHAKVISQLALPKSDLPPSARAVFDDTQRLYQVEIVHFGDGKPVQFERRFVDLTIIPAFEYQDFIQSIPATILSVKYRLCVAVISLKQCLAHLMWRFFWNVRKTRLLCVCLATLIQAIKWLLLYKCGMMEPRFVLMEQ
jgi:transcriptional regulator, gntR family